MHTSIFLKKVAFSEYIKIPRSYNLLISYGLLDTDFRTQAYSCMIGSELKTQKVSALEKLTGFEISCISG